MSTDVDPLSGVVSDVKSAVSAVGRTAGAAVRRSAEFAREAAPALKEAGAKAGGMGAAVIVAIVGFLTWPFRQWLLFLLNIVALPIFGVVYVTVGASGTRVTHPFFATKLYKAIPFLAKYRFAHEYDLAVVAALILGAACAVMVVFMWRILLRGSLGRDGEFHAARAAKTALCLACILLTVDFCIFLQGIRDASIWNDGVTATQIVLAIGWSTLLIVYGWLHVMFER